MFRAVLEGTPLIAAPLSMDLIAFLVPACAPPHDQSISSNFDKGFKQKRHFRTAQIFLGNNMLNKLWGKIQYDLTANRFGKRFSLNSL